MPPDEEERRRALHRLAMLDTPGEERFDRITRTAARLFGVPIALVSLVDTNRQWFKSCHGLAVRQTPRGISFCGHAILQDQVLQIPDAHLDPRFADNPLVTGEPFIRFYAGQPLKSPDGHRIGTLCLIDRQPRHLADTDLGHLADLAAWAEEELGRHGLAQALELSLESDEHLQAILVSALDCIIAMDQEGRIIEFNPAAEKTLGYPRSQVLGRPLHEVIIPPDLRAAHQAGMQRFLATGQSQVLDQRLELPALRADGTIFPAEISISAVRISGRTIFSSHLRDITDRQHTERLRKQTLVTERLHRAILELEMEKLSDFGHFVELVARELEGVGIGFDAVGFNFVEEKKNALTAYRVPREGKVQQQTLALDHPDLHALVENWLQNRVWKRPGTRGLHAAIDVPFSEGTLAIEVPDKPDEIEQIVAFLHTLCPLFDLAMERIRDRMERLGAQASLVAAKEEAENSSRTYRSVVDNAVDAVIITDEQGIVFAFNPAAERIFGYETAQVLGQRVDMLISESPLGDAADPWAPTRGGLQPFLGITREVAGRRQDGSVFPMELAVNEFSLIGMRMLTAIGRDITKRKLEEDDLRRSNDLLEVLRQIQTRFLASDDHHPLFNDLLDNLLNLTQSDFGFIGEVLYDEGGKPYLKTHSITNIAWNAETRRFYDEHAPQGMEFRNLDTLFGAVMTTAQPVIANHPATDPRRGGLPEGHPPMHAFLGLPLCHNDQLVGMVGIANRPGGFDDAIVAFLQPFLATCTRLLEAYRSLLKQRAAEAALRFQKTVLETQTETSLDGILTVSSDGQWLSVNQRFVDIWGIPRGLLATGSTAQNLEILKSRVVDERAFVDQIAYLYAHKDEKSQEEIAFKDGRIFDRYSAPIVDADGVYYGRVWYYRDITERKAVERMKTEFISVVSHELRTPLTSIRGSLGLLAGGVAGSLSDQGKQLVDIALNNSDRLTRLINDILDIEKIESGKMEFRFEPVSMASLVRQAVEANRAYADLFGVNLAIGETEAQTDVYADPDRLLQVLANLISNAAKFSPRGGTVVISLAVEGGQVWVRVADQGPGIPEEFRSRIFQKFAQADSSDTRQKGGTGLGLSISKAIVEHLGGDIGYETELGVGTTFYFLLPLFHAAEGAISI